MVQWYRRGYYQIFVCIDSIYGIFVSTCILDFWQSSHVLANSLQLLLTFKVKSKQSVITLCVSLNPGCDVLCIDWNDENGLSIFIWNHW